MPGPEDTVVHERMHGRQSEGLDADVPLREHSELAREKMWSRIYLIPVLQAEEDRDQVRRYLADRAREKELTGVNTEVYHSDRYVCFLGVGTWEMSGGRTELS